jgi:hypothetical protein
LFSLDDFTITRMGMTPVAAARDRADISVPSLAAAVGITEAACWDLLDQPGEVSMCLTLRQLVRLAAVSPLSLVPNAPARGQSHRTFPELADAIREFCSARGFSADQFGEKAGWDVQHFLEAPDSALDDWCLDSLRGVCDALDLHWPDFLPDATPSSNQAMQRTAPRSDA